MSEEFNSGDQYSDAADPVHNEVSEHAQQETQVPLDALQSERALRQSAQDEAKMMRENMQLMMANQQRQQLQQKDEFENISSDDVITYGDLQKILSKKEKAYEMSLQELKMTQKHPDYQNVITQYLPEVIKNNPSLGRTLENTQDYELAYHLAKNSDVYKNAHKKVKKNADAERIVQNANRAGSLSSVGQSSPISEAKRWKDMSDSEFMQASQKNLGYI